MSCLDMALNMERRATLLVPHLFDPNSWSHRRSKVEAEGEVEELGMEKAVA